MDVLICNFIFFLNFVVYHKCWGDCPVGVGLTDYTGPLLASNLVNWQAAQLLSWVLDMCTELPRLGSRNREGEWRKVSMGLWEGPVRVPWKMPLLLNNLLCCSSLKPTSPAPAPRWRTPSTPAGATVPSRCSLAGASSGWGSPSCRAQSCGCTWVPRLTEAPQRCLPLYRHFCCPSLLRGKHWPLSWPGSSFTPAWHHHWVCFQVSWSFPRSPRREDSVCQPWHGDMWSLGRLLPCTGDGVAAGQAKTWYFWKAQNRVGDLLWGLQWVPVLPSYFPWDIPVLWHPHPGTKHRGETCLHPHVSFTADPCAPTQHYHEKLLLTDTKPKLQYENYSVWKLNPLPTVLHQTQIVKMTTIALAGTTSEGACTQLQQGKVALVFMGSPYIKDGEVIIF